MPDVASHKPGSFCWMELGTTDQQAAKTFYGELFGWAFTDHPMGPSEIYTMFNLDGLDTAAAFQIGGPLTGMPTHWMPYISVVSADETASKVEALGGKLIRPPFDVFTNGRMAVVQDPTGAMFCLWEPKTHPGIGLIGEDGAFCWADLNTTDPAKAKRFYEELFGWEIVASPGDHSGYLHVKNGDEYIAGIPPAEHHKPGVPSHWLIYFQTPDCDGSTAKAEDQGSRIFVPPMSVPRVGRISVLADPQGAVFALYEPQHAA